MKAVKEEIRRAKRQAQRRRKDILQVEKAGRELSRIGQHRSFLTKAIKFLKRG